MLHDPVASKMPLGLVPPRLDEWPAAIRSAELQRGTLVRCGPGVRLVSWPETPRVRLTALAPWLGTELIAVLETAAWVWGASSTPGRPMHLSTQHRRRTRGEPPVGALVHQFSYAPHAIVRYGPFEVTTPLRTVTDLLRLPEEFTHAHRVSCRLLLLSAEIERSLVDGALAVGPPPHRRRARARLSAL
ncbi:hypothetical protein [Leucobacter luti]|uniref:hypothetical protein n=1 Tax=Leucobacter luti TaxID=340320 RepID=UPI001C688A75|nr:hypothetical protein [Leucobacter luti]QYM76068.1 hypothetical protein K1X41_00825 [Leucobacter luti]